MIELYDYRRETTSFEPPEGSTEMLPRFIIEQPFVVAAYRSAQQRVLQIMRGDATILGATTFGSTTKGYARAGESDLDMTVFIDADQPGLVPDPAEIQNGTAPLLGDWYVFGKSAYRRFQSYDERLKAQCNSDIEPSSVPALEIRPSTAPLSFGYLALLAADEVSKARKYFKYQALRQSAAATDIDALADWATIATDGETLSTLPGIRNALQAAGVKTKVIDCMTVDAYLHRQQSVEQTEVSALRSEVFWSNRFGSNMPLRLFTVAITEGLQPYRQAFLDGLAQAEQPDQAWTFFKNRLAKFENGAKHPRDISRIIYPDTLDEAQKIYQ